MSTIQATDQTALVQFSTLAKVSNNDLQSYLQQYTKKIPGPINFIVSIWKSLVSYLALCEQKISILTTDKGFVKISKSSALKALKNSDAVIKTGEKVSSVVQKQAFIHALLIKKNLTSEDLSVIVSMGVFITVEKRLGSEPHESLEMQYKLTHDVAASGIAIQLCNEFNARGDTQIRKKAQDADASAQALSVEIATRTLNEQHLMALADQESALTKPIDPKPNEAEEPEENLSQEAEAKALAPSLPIAPAIAAAEEPEENLSQEAEGKASAPSLPIAPAIAAADGLEAIEESEEEDLSIEKQLECTVHGTQLGRELLDIIAHQRKNGGRLAPTHQSDAKFDNHPTDEQLITILAFTKKNGANLIRDEESSAYVAYLNGLDQESKLTLQAMAEEVAKVKTGPYLTLIRSL